MRHLPKILLSSISILVVIGLLVTGNTGADKIGGLNLSLSLTSSYNGTLAFVDDYFVDNGIYYTNDINHPISLGSTSTSTYTIQGDIQSPINGSGIGSYDTQDTVSLTPGEGIKEIFIDYIAPNGDRVRPDPIEIYLDTTPPSTPILNGPLLGTVQSAGGILFDWSSSSDGESGLNEYELIISTSPSMSNPITFTTEQESLLVYNTLLPAGTLYRYVKAKDNVGNESVGVPSYFTHNRRIGVKSTIERSQGNSNSGNTPQTHTGPSDDEIVIGDTLYESTDQQNPVDNGLTYYFTFDDEVENDKRGVIEIISSQNTLNIIVNKKNEQQSHGSAEQTNTIGEASNTFGGLTLPQYLQKTGADITELRYHLGMIEKYFPDEYVQQQLRNLISLLSPKRHSAMIIFLILLCYDVETWDKRMKLQKK